MIGTLSEWNMWWQKGKVDVELLGKKRLILNELKNTLSFKEMKLLIGIRRSGKSTLFYQLIDYLLKSGVEPKRILLINFEDDLLSKKSLKEIFDVYQSNINPNTKPFLFLDEVHRCSEWSLFLKKLYDLKKVNQIFITDSSSKFIKKEYAKVLTGRNVKITIFPLSFKEFVNWKIEKLKQPLTSGNINRLKKELNDYVKWGGFPEVFFKTSSGMKKKILTEYFSDIIDKDIIERYNVNYSKIKPLADFLLANIGSLFSPRKYSRVFGLSLESIDTYLHYLQEVMLFFMVPRFSYSIRTQQLSPKKVYACDPGLLNNVGFKFSENRGRVYENIVFIELKRQGKEVYYWKGRYECDFVIKEGLKIKSAIQVCSDLTHENKEREINGLIEALNTFKLKTGIIITENHKETSKINGKKIIFIPLWKWLLKLF